MADEGVGYVSWSLWNWGDDDEHDGWYAWGSRGSGDLDIAMDGRSELRA
jgi:hypothetical protein